MYTGMIMKIINLIKSFWRAAVVLFLMAACEQSYETVAGGEGIISLNLYPVMMNEPGLTVKTIDEGTSDDYHVEDFWLFEYDENNVLLGAPRYYTTDDFDFSSSVPAAVILPTSSGITYKVVIVANTHDASLLSSISYNTLSALQTSGRLVSFSEDLHQGTDLLMNAVGELNSTTSSVNCMLYRNVAKLTMNIRNSVSSGIVINSIQLKNVPHKLCYADRLYDGQLLSPDVSSVDFVNLEKNILNITEGGSVSVTYYLPRNKRGTNSSTTEAGKNVNAPEKATYVEVIGTRSATGTPVCYKFYLGANEINDFNIVPNSHYQVSLDFTLYGDANDNRVEDLGTVLLEESNSYIINPSDGTGVRYVVPIENKINTFWQSAAGRLNADFEDYLIGGDKEWVAEVIWQDVNRKVISFCMDDGSLSDTYSGMSDDRFFSFVTTDAAVGTPCNVLIGVRRNDSEWNEEDGYMWSWHLWLTDYDPYEDPGLWIDGQYVYPVTGGSLHRYSSFDNIAAFNGRDVYIMDRNLGAKGYTRDDGWALSAGMMYQYGRKEPFPTSDRLYDINGQEVMISRLSGPVDMHLSVTYPKLFFTMPDKGDADWVDANNYMTYDWNDIMQKAVKNNGKSFLDPCPPGWKLPYNDVWLDFGNSKEAYASNWVSVVPEENPYKTTDYDAGWNYYLNGSGKSGDTAYYPGAGLRNYGTGNYGGGGNGAMWSAKPAGANGIYLYYENKASYYTLPGQTFYRYMGMPVRCISYK